MFQKRPRIEKQLPVLTIEQLMMLAARREKWQAELWGDYTLLSAPSRIESMGSCIALWGSVEQRRAG